MNNSMINPSITELLEKLPNRYSIVVVTSKRARQLIDGAKPLIEIDSNKPVTIAINEIDCEALNFELVKEGSK